MRALVTGSGGFCGRHLCRYLAEQGVEVFTAGTRADPSPHHQRVTDITDIERLMSVFERVRPDFLFHLAGLMQSPDPAEFYRVNTQFAVAILYALERAGLVGCPVLLAGTSAEYGIITEEDCPLREDMAPHPYNHYGISKLAQTFEALAAGSRGRPVVIARPFNIFGPGMPKHLVPRTFAVQIAKIIKGQTMPVIEVGNLKSSRDFITVEDAVKAYWGLIQNPDTYGQIVNVCSGEGTVVEDMLKKLIELSGMGIQLRADASRFKSLDFPVHYGHVGKLRAFLGYVPDANYDVALRGILEEARRTA